MTTTLLIIIYVDLHNNSLRNLLDVFQSATQLPNYVISGLMWGGLRFQIWLSVTLRYAQTVIKGNLWGSMLVLADLFQGIDTVANARSNALTVPAVCY